MTDEFIGHLADKTDEQKLIARVRAKVQAMGDPAFVGKGVVDLGDGPYPGQVADRACVVCGFPGGVKWRFSRTAYEWDGKGENPNACIALCGTCGDVYNDMMDRKWAEFFRERGFKV